MTSNKYIAQISGDSKVLREVLPNKQFGRADHWNTESEAEHNEAYEAHLAYQATAKVYPVEWLTEADNASIKVEGVDFEIFYQELYVGNMLGHAVWLDSTEEQYKQLNEPRRRIIAVPIDKQDEPEDDIYDAVRKLRDDHEYGITEEVKQAMIAKSEGWNDEIRPHILRGIGMGWIMRTKKDKQEGKPERMFTMEEAVEIFESGYDRGFADAEDKNTHLGEHEDSQFNWLRKEKYFEKTFNIDL